MDVHGFPVRLVGEGLDLPAWVQAIGSVAAIIFAVLIQRKGALEVASARYSALIGVFAFCNAISADIEAAWEQFAAGDPQYIFDRNRVAHARALLEGIPTFEMGNVQLANMVYEMTDAIAFFERIEWPAQHVARNFDFADNLFEVRSKRQVIKEIYRDAMGMARSVSRAAHLWWWPFSGT